MIYAASILAVLMYGIGETGFFYFKKRNDEIKKTIFKCFATSCSVILCALALAQNHSTAVLFILTGIIVSAVADAVINFRFIKGMYVFLTAHIFFIIAFSIISFPGIYSILIFALNTALLILLFKKLHPLGELLVPGIIYAAVINVMVSTAIPLSFNGSATGIILAAGAVLFMLSDVWLAKHIRFGSRHIFEICSLTMYYTGLYLIALSCALM